MGRERDVGKTAGSSTDDSSYRGARMLKYDEYYSIKGRNGSAPT